MRTLLVGSGGREYAWLQWLMRSSGYEKFSTWVARGNGGTEQLAINHHSTDPNDVEAVVALAQRLSPDIVLVGPERPLVHGLVDRLAELGISTFGPTQAAAQVEGSKVYMRELLREIGVPQQWYRVFNALEDILDFLGKWTGPIVVKADGLWEGKGVSVCLDNESAIAFARFLFSERDEPVLLEEVLSGPEVSVFAFSDGQRLSKPVAACDYKRVGDGDVGANTGGMGSYSPPEFWTPELEAEAMAIMQAVITALADRGTPYVGMLYGGFILTADGLRVLEFNCRMGDPEAQVVLPQLVGDDPYKIVQACIEGRLDTVAVHWTGQPHVGVSLVSGGYPGSYGVNKDITGLSPSASRMVPNTMVCHAGTRLTRGKRPRVVTNGGRVLTVVGWGDSIEEARMNAYQRVGQINFDGMQYRRDIAQLPRK